MSEGLSRQKKLASVCQFWHNRTSDRPRDLAARFHQEYREDADGRYRPRGQTDDGGGVMARKRKAGVSEETVDEFLAEQGMLGSAEDLAVKEFIAEQLAAAMAEQGLTKIEMAARMKTSQRQLDRLFDPAIPSVTLDTLRRAASAVGRSLRIDLV